MTTMGTMKAVGIKELKARLSEFVRLVKSGETVLVTERDEVVAELRAGATPAATRQSGRYSRGPCRFWRHNSFRLAEEELDVESPRTRASHGDGKRHPR